MRALKTIGLVTLGVVVGLTVSVFAWTGPTATAPSGNVPAPINVGSASQTKNGYAGFSGIGVFGTTMLDAALNPIPSLFTYLNFSNLTSPISGASGYGIRDNNGTLEFKNSGGSWQTLQQTVATFVGSGGQTAPYLPTYVAWASQGTGDGGAAVYNDNGSYKTLMIVGNNSAGGNRAVKVWDDLTVSNNLYVGNGIHFANGTVQTSAAPSYSTYALVSCSPNCTSVSCASGYTLLTSTTFAYTGVNAAFKITVGMCGK
jgi:hypothetical protein